MNLIPLSPHKHKKRRLLLTNLYNQEVDNDMKVEYSMNIFKKIGQIFPVSPPSKKTLLMKNGNCYHNAITKMQKGFQYVEGVITSLQNGNKISHAWNVDSEGNHIDFTVRDCSKYEYIGVIKPINLLYEIGALNRHVWYTTLPYLKLK